MAGCGDEGIKKKFFFDLKRLFFNKKHLEVDVDVDAGNNVGLIESKQTDSSSVASKESLFDCDDDRYMQRPIRPHAQECSFFIRTGTCKFGPICKFNHPLSTNNRNLQVDGEKSKGNGVGSPKDLSQIPCKFYQTGSCKNGESCKFNHSEVNVLGFPKRLGKTDCSYYMRTGMCGFGVSCRFHHPDPIFVLESELYSSNFTGDPSQLYLSVPETTSGSFMYMHQDCVVSGYQKCSGAPECKQETKSSSSSSPPADNAEIVGYYAVDPPKREPCVLNDVGLPIRPGKKVCWNYKNLGLCKFGRACVYDHPKKRSSTDGSTSESLSGGKTQDTHK